MEKYLYLKKDSLTKHQFDVLDEIIKGGGVKIITQVYYIYKIINPLTLFRFNKEYLNIRFKSIEE